jgi:hypothetical protein
MSKIISQVAPTNVLEEKEKFFASRSYNPQFTYTKKVAESELSQWGLPQEKLFKYCQAMLPQTKQMVKESSEIITIPEIESVIENFNTSWATIEPLNVHFSSSYVSRCYVTAGNIFFQLPIIYSRSQFLGLMRHELETHILRLHNNQLQPWSSELFPDKKIRRTEEGLANLHTFLFRDDKQLRKTFCSYLATWVGQHGSFREVYETLRSHHFNESTSWNVAVKVKRGIEDTSRPGGLTKEICYLEGTIQVWDWIVNQKNDPHQLYLGRIGIEQLTELAPIAKQHSLLFPTFFEDMEVYYKMIQEIGITNNFVNLQ